MRQPDARFATYSNSAVLPTPASPHKTTTRLWPVLTPAISLSSASHSLSRPRSLATGSRSDIANAEAKAGPRPRQPHLRVGIRPVRRHTTHTGRLPAAAAAASMQTGSRARWTDDQGSDPGDCPDASKRAPGERPRLRSFPQLSASPTHDPERDCMPLLTTSCVPAGFTETT